MNLKAFLVEFLSQPLAMKPTTTAVLVDLAKRGEISAGDVRAAVGRRSSRPSPRKGKVAVIAISGLITQHEGVLVDLGLATSTEHVNRMLKYDLADPDVESIVLHTDSPGGGVYGVGELAAEIRAARRKKKIVAVANSQMASAAYYIGSAADEIVVTPGGELGSIGVFTAHQDLSGALEQQGVAVTLISAGKHKVDGNPFEPLGKEARAEMQKTVNAYYDAFVNAVAKGRDVRASEVRGGFGEGRMVVAKEAVRLGMADRIEPYGQAIYRLANAKDQAQIIRKNRCRRFEFERAHGMFK